MTSNKDIAFAGVICLAVCIVFCVIVLGLIEGGRQTVDMANNCVNAGGTWINTNYNCIK